MRGSSRWKRSRQRQQAEDTAPDLDRQRALRQLADLIRKLKPLDRQIVISYLEGMDAASIAEITGLSAANVAMKVHRIKNILSHRFLEEQHYVLSQRRRTNWARMEISRRRAGCEYGRFRGPSNAGVACQLAGRNGEAVAATLLLLRRSVAALEMARFRWRLVGAAVWVPDFLLWFADGSAPGAARDALRLPARIYRKSWSGPRLSAKSVVVTRPADRGGVFFVAIVVGRAYPGAERLESVLPLVALLAVWTGYGITRRRRQANALQREIDGSGGNR